MNKKGFLLVEVLIAGVILSSAIAAGFFLVRNGLNYVDRVEKANYVSSLIPVVKNRLEILQPSQGTFKLDEQTVVTYRFTLEKKGRPQFFYEGTKLESPFELYIYRVEFDISYKGYSRSYEFYTLRYTGNVNPQELL
ncbi:MAG: type II secretion system protein [Sulfurihydrogenibium sp.]|uniref:type II secretion system protein n=1 Tax=Sulfurihydrogenibium sp. TaxID=2053621 RepID=UPI003C7CBA2D